MNTIKNSRAYILMEADEGEKRKQMQKIMNNNINITYYIDLNYRYLIVKFNLQIMLNYPSTFKVYDYLLE